MACVLGLLLILLGLHLLAYGAHGYRLLRVVKIDDTVIHISDTSTYSQIASLLAHGEIYQPVETGVGHIYGPAVSWYVVSILRLFGSEISIVAVRILLYVTYMVSLGGLLALLCSSMLRESRSRLAFLFLVVAFLIGIGFMNLSNVRYAGVHPVYLLFFLLVIEWFLFQHAQHFSFSFLFVSVVLWTGAVWLTHQPFVLCSIAFGPVLWRRAKTGRLSAVTFLVCSFAAVAGAFLIVYYYSRYGNAFDWTVLVPLSQEAKPIAESVDLVLRQDPFLAVLFSWVLVSGILGIRTGQRGALQRTLFLLTLFLASAVGFRKIGGSARNFATACFFTIVLGAEPWIQYLTSRRSVASILILLAGASLLSRYSLDITQKASAYLDWMYLGWDRHSSEQLVSVLDYCSLNDLSCYVDSAPAYYAQKRLPFEYEACHVWELSKSTLMTEAISAAILRDIDQLKWDVVILREGEDPRAWGRRCLPQEVISSFRSTYFYSFSIRNDTVEKLYADVFLASQVPEWLPGLKASLMRSPD